jgi:IS5 family transposase
LVHTLVTTAANAHEVTQGHALLQGEERIAFGDAGYQGLRSGEEKRTPDVKWPVALRPGKRRALPDNELSRVEEKIEKLKAGVRAKVEPLPPHQEPLPDEEGVLPWATQAHSTVTHAARLGKSADRQATTSRTSRPRCALRGRQGEKSG